MRIDYHDLHEEQFENLVTAICKDLLGASTQKFTKGKDGGRDSKFTGTANDFPNKSHPYTGKFIVQAKHTFNPVAKMSSSDFHSSSKRSTIAEEIPRITDLIEHNEVDHYILFTNRRDSANKTVEIENELLELGLDSATLYGIENLDMFLKLYPNALTIADIDHFDAPIRVIPDELAEVILSLRNAIDEMGDIKDKDAKEQFDRTEFDDKCRLNFVPEDYKDFIVRNYLKEFYKIDEFLARPANEELQTSYIDTAEEFHLEILERIGNTSLDKLLNELRERLFYRDINLKRNRRLTRAVLFYMFWKCDIGLDN